MISMSQALCDFFGCLHLPFGKSLAARDLFPSTAHQEIQARLAFALHNHFATLITGEVGTGTAQRAPAAVRAFVQALDPNLYLTAYLPNPNLTVQALFAHLLRSTASFAVTAFHVSANFHPRGRGERLRNTLADLSQRGIHPILVVDEAHLLSHRLLHELRYRLNADTLRVPLRPLP